MRSIFKIPSRLLAEVRKDFERPHPFAAERVGFIGCNVARLAKDGLLVLAHSFYTVEDQDYLDDPRVGAMMGSNAIRKALEISYNARISMFHVHLHEHHGRPWFSSTDLRETANFVPDFWHVQPKLPHGALVLSHDVMAGLCWIPGAVAHRPTRIQEFISVGAPFETMAEGGA